MTNSMMPSQGVSVLKKPTRALVTGGAVRVGRSIALALAEAGMDVAIGYYHSAAEAQRTVHQIENRHVRGTAIRADLGHAAAARQLVERAAKALGGLEVLVNNAAIFYRTPFGTTTSAQYDDFLDLNLRAQFFCAQAAAEIMRGRGGHIVNIGDAAAGQALPSYIPYALSKAALAALTKSLALALRRSRIAVNCVAPGPVLRPSRFPRARWNAVTRGREATVEDVAAAVRFFATCPRSITGQTLEISGGDAG